MAVLSGGSSTENWAKHSQLISYSSVASTKYYGGKQVKGEHKFYNPNQKYMVLIRVIRAKALLFTLTNQCNGLPLLCQWFYSTCRNSICNIPRCGKSTPDTPRTICFHPLKIWPMTRLRHPSVVVIPLFLVLRPTPAAIIKHTYLICDNQICTIMRITKPIVKAQTWVTYIGC